MYTKDRKPEEKKPEVKCQDTQTDFSQRRILNPIGFVDGKCNAMHIRINKK